MKSMWTVGVVSKTVDPDVKGVHSCLRSSLHGRLYPTGSGSGWNLGFSVAPVLTSTRWRRDVLYPTYTEDPSTRTGEDLVSGTSTSEGLGETRSVGS